MAPSGPLSGSLMDPRTPILVGAAAVQQRLEDPNQAREALDLMGDAVVAAGEDSGCPEILSRVGWIACPRGFWDYADPGRALAERIGAPGAHSIMAEIGVLQTTTFGGAGRAIAEGRADVCLIAGGESKFRSLRGQILGAETPFRPAPGEPDETWRPQEDIMHPIELQLNLAMPVKQYALIENALRIAEGQGVEEHRQEVAELYAGMSQVAAANPDAWSREALRPDAIREAGGGNRMLAFPYTKHHNSQWNVDQAGALILCAAETADALGIPADKRVVLRAVAESNFMLPLGLRAEVHRSAGFAAAGRAAFESAGLEPASVNHRELYSCFPSAVRLQQRELEVPRDLPVTVTGGMAAAGGPLNNFVLQAAVRMAQVLRNDPGSVGMVNAVSGILTKQGVSLWSTEAGPAFTHSDVSQEADEGTKRVELVETASQEARVLSTTVEFDREGPERGVVLAEVQPGQHALAISTDRDLAAALTQQDLGNQSVKLHGDGTFSA